MKVICNQERCKQCGLCVANCPEEAIKFSENLNSSGYKETIIDDDRCIGCGICYIMCPDGVYEILGD